MTPASEQRRDKFFALVKRFNRLGCLLPDPANFTAADAAALDETEMVMAEMRKIRAEMDAVLDEENAVQKADR